MVQTIGELLPFAARRYGDKTALVVDGRSFTFNELDALASAFANGLVAAGVEPGDRVTLWGPNSWQWLVAYYAIAKTGAVLNPVNVMLTPEEVEYIVKDAGACTIVASADKAPALMDMKGNTGLSQVVIWGDKSPAGATPFDQWLRGARTFTPRPRKRTDTGAICYTSGTTGHPKGAVQSHRALVACAQGTALMQARTTADTVVSPLPAPHVYGSAVYNASMLVGATLVLLPRFTEEGVLEAIQQNRATIFDCVPTAYYYLLAYPKLSSYDLSSLLRCTVGGQTLPAAKSLEWTERTGGVPVQELWGMTELCGPATGNPHWGDNKPGTIGLPMPGTFCKIVDVDNPDKEMPQGERGELMVKGPLVMDGYAGNDKATRETVRPDGWMHTGDIATVDADGYYTIVDRKKDMILTAGFNVYPAELERVLCMHPAVALAAVCGVADEAKGELAKAYIMLKPGASASGRELVEHCRQHLAAYKLPRAVQFVANVPVTGSGKIMRRLLKDVDDGTRAASEQRQTRAG